MAIRKTTQTKTSRTAESPRGLQTQSIATHLPVQDEIRRRAYELYEQRGKEDGRDWEDWFRAEAELSSKEKAVGEKATLSRRAS